MAEDTNDQNAETPKGQRNRLPLVIALAVGLTVGAMAGSFIVGPLVAEGGGGAAAAEDVCITEDAAGADGHGATGARPVHTVSDVVLNPASTGGTRYLVLTVSFSVRDSALATRMKDRDPEVRDVILKVLGAKTVDQLSDLAARPALKEEVRANVGRLFGDKSVSDVFFPQFVIQ